MFKLSEKTQTFLEDFKDCKVVFTNGCFDILHAGHIQYLNEASELGDVLVVGLNSDASIKRLKGNDRPVNCQEDRKFILENLKCVHCVEIFDEDTPLELIKAISPNVLVKGGDWKVEDIVGYDFVTKNGGTVKTLSFLPGRSTTSTIEKIRSL